MENSNTLEKTDLHERFKKTLDHLNYTKNRQHLSNEIGIPRSTLDKSYKGSMPSLFTISKLATRYKKNIDYIWLLTGEGDITPQYKNHDRQMSKLQENKADYGYSVEERISFLQEIHEKDQKIGKLQDEVSSLKQKVIDMLEKQINNYKK